MGKITLAKFEGIENLESRIVIEENFEEKDGQNHRLLNKGYKNVKTRLDKYRHCETC